MRVFETIRCPVCNRVYPGKFWSKIASVVRDCLGYLMHARGGRVNCGFERVAELRLRRDVEPGTMAIVKGRLLAAVKLWLQRGWLLPEELRDMVNDIKYDGVSAWRVVFTYECPGFKPVGVNYGQVSVAKPMRFPLNRYKEEAII